MCKFRAVVPADRCGSNALAGQQQVKQDTRSRSLLAVDEAHAGLRQVGQAGDAFRISLSDENSLRAVGQVDQRVLFRIEPRRVAGRRGRAELADRHVESRQVAFAARKRRHRLGAAAVFDIDRDPLLFKLRHQRRDREPVRCRHAQRLRRRLGQDAGQLLLQLGRQAVEQRRQARGDALIGPDQLFRQRRQHGALAAHLEHQFRAELRTEFAQQTPRVAIRKTAFRGRPADAAKPADCGQQREQRRQGERHPFGVAQSPIGLYLHFDHMQILSY